jgi:hypothetical protein
MATAAISGLVVSILTSINEVLLMSFQGFMMQTETFWEEPWDQLWRRVIVAILREPGT